MANLLIELLTEELPPKRLRRLGESLSEGIETGLRQEGFLSAKSVCRSFAAPRRLGLLLSEVMPVQPDKTIERKGPSKSAAFNQDGTPTPALQGFARSVGLEIPALDTQIDAKGVESFVFRAQEKGASLATVLQTLLAEVLAKLPVQKVMRWGAGDLSFVRPVHGFVALLDEEILPLEVLGHSAGRSTRGHRFLSTGDIRIPHASAYETLMRDTGKVIAHFDDRKASIAAQLQSQLGKDRAMAGEDLLDEVTALVEWPTVYGGHFDEEFLRVPTECLTLSMKSHQKYFPVGNPDGKLTSRFLLVSNLETARPESIIAGNERVLRARLADARFFFEQDQKRSLGDRVPALDAVVYHNKLGSLGDRVRRLTSVSRAIAIALGEDSAIAERAAALSKADLITDMVGEFPELQGVMGGYYAHHDQEPEAVCSAIREHYQPRFAGDALPHSALGRVVALADKLDTLVGIYGIGQIPTGDKDPFALRRQALGVIRLLIEHQLPLSIRHLLTLSFESFPGGVLAGDTVEKLEGFVRDRVRHTLREQGYSAESIEAVLTVHADTLDTVLQRLEAVQAFMGRDLAQSLAAANKRIHNLLKKAKVSDQPAIHPSLFEHAAERQLYEAMERLRPAVDTAMAENAYVEALGLLSGIRQEVDGFFTEVMVMADDDALRQNRLAILVALDTLMNQVADLSHLAPSTPQ